MKESGFLQRLVNVFPAEFVHKFALFLLRNNLIPNKFYTPPQSLGVDALNEYFSSPLGLAAGFDKNGDAIPEALSLGFGYVEVGTVTRYSQFGEIPPRLFKVPEHKAIINRMGFNNKGVEYLLSNLQDKELIPCLYGINIGYNKDSKDPIGDLEYMLRILYGSSAYIAINVSSPNTPNLRKMQAKDAFEELVIRMHAVRASLDSARSLPILFKISPDSSESEQKDIADIVLKHGVSGLIVTNTTISNGTAKFLQGKRQKGGLSGRPLFELSTIVLRNYATLLRKKAILIGVGGIFTGRDAYEKILNGATLVQIYTAMSYRGFYAPIEIQNELVACMESDGYKKMSHIIGAKL